MKKTFLTEGTLLINCALLVMVGVTWVVALFYGFEVDEAMKVINTFAISGVALGGGAFARKAAKEITHIKGTGDGTIEPNPRITA